MNPPPVFQLDSTELKKGVSLIEASAGTGKTFTIGGLFLRLVLEHGLFVQEILTVTYTVAATEELRGRIRETLAAALKAFETHASEVPFIQALAERFSGQNQDKIALLEQAIRGFDEAPIYTIHGFCQHTLQDRAFESGNLFDTELVADQGPILVQALEDFWRRHVSAAGKIAAAFAAKHEKSPESFLPLINSCLPHRFLKVLSPVAGYELPVLAADLESTFGVAQEVWRRDKDTIKSLFGDQATWGNKPYNRSDEMALLFGQVDAALAQADFSAAALASLDKFTAESIEQGRSKKSKAPAPQHHFFDLCSALATAEDRFLAGLDWHALQFVQRDLRRRKEVAKVQSFDDLLNRLLGALEAPGGDLLAAALRGQYRAALIDEFQDTDPVQHRIFRRVFARGDTFLFLVGDPKQAIYGFRGADVFTYLEAARQVEHRYTLKENWRSESGLVNATNHLFATNPRPFVLHGIQFYAVEAKGNADKTPLRIGGQALPPFQVWFWQRDNKKITKGEAEKILPAAVASEIARLLNGNAELGERRLLPEDVAVLVPENRQARLMHDALNALNIPSVLYTTESLFKSHEVAETKYLLAAIAEPGNEPLLKTALATDILGHTAQKIEQLAADETTWQDTLQRFHDYLDVWVQRGFIQMFRGLLQGEEVHQRLLRFPDGERRMTNLLHFGELLHKASVENRLGATGLIKWISEKEDPEFAPDEHQLRLERDEKAVRLVTIHRSKGLEYPVVFCPFSWKSSDIEHNREKIVLFHEPQSGEQVRDLGSGDVARHVQLARIEKLAENVRLLYVALTRAKHRCYLAWGGVRNTATSAPAWLLHPPENPEPNPVEALEKKFGELDSTQMLADLQRLGSESRGTLAVDQLPPASDEKFTPLPAVESQLSPRTFTGHIQRDWRIASFSSLTAGRDDEQPDHDAVWQVPDTESEATGIFAFPRGVRAGTCLHKIFEKLDYQRWSEPATKDLIADELRAQGVSPMDFAGIVHEMLGKALSVPLPFTLATIGMERRLNELEFCFPLGRISPRPLQLLMARHGVLADDEPERFGFSPLTGVLKGYIDLVFQWEGRFYIIDWKSNWLGNRVEDYGPAALRDEIQRRSYFLQYQLYTVALDKYLRLRLPGYSYERHFGGVFYIFVRGVDPAWPELGIYRDRPSERLVRELGEMLSGNAAIRRST
jgi:exodeoxyribonuclease V beta subunit